MPNKDTDVQSLIQAWTRYGVELGPQKQLDTIKNALYAYRNGLMSEKELPATLVSPDGEVMAAVEHYFYARSEVCSAEYSLTNMKTMIVSYQVAKALGLDLRHNKNNPTSPPSELQKQWALRGADDGERDRLMENARRKTRGEPTLEPPLFRMPPNFTGAFKNIRLDKVMY
jgi:hypothetical protein